ncbi:MAG: ATP-binding protein [Bacteroidales bacterium]|nr:ATP-binding protein [Bacteroidales bacterium]
MLLSKKYIEQQTEPKTHNREILDLVEQVTPDPKHYASVPVFYRSLMSSGSKINDEFWVTRYTETKLLKAALQRHKNGIGGAVVIKGVHGAGKTALSRYAAQHLFKRGNAYWIDAPVNGTTDPNDFLAELQKQFVGFGDFAGIFNNLPRGCALVINDLELWWERRPDGGAAVAKIMELVEQYSHKVFFYY